MQARTPSNSKGIDISHWNGVIDFHAVKNDGINFVYIKATEGWDKWLVWQYAEDGEIKEIKGNVDLNAGPLSLDLLR